MPEYVDESGDRTWTYVVYVIELDPAACAKAHSPCGGANCGRIPVYVGQTSRTPQERFEQHKRGRRASLWVKRYGLHLRPRLYGAFGEMTRDDALAAEAEQARRLRNRGGGTKYCVYGGH